ncbi:MAG: alpha-L-rhamnosidase [Bacteroidetes bacterium GWF2_42_66]|nr:MAG: alpha-L-rhamnosidase [Bacteroidetes bacterium GWA2_42_15]OFY00396.1 MAG: alpha-L-rhamnosidase [Bacteroidetes bacterium GWE2_42_39]OFY47220.1 MAG: alpha-L-rhamnosidase [Bacteroidetes bacterium GWF2_42_66]
MVTILPAMAQFSPVFTGKDMSKVRSTDLTRKYLTPERIVWISDPSLVQNAERILNPGIGQADLNSGGYLTLKSTKDSFGGIVVDFGKEIQGGVEIVTTRGISKEKNKVRIRFGESVSEAMSDIDINGATNDHAMRDFVVALPWLGRLEVGNSGFRFVRIDLIDPENKIEIKEISAIFTYRDIPYLGSFTCNDERLNQIWMTGAYTVHLNMQDYLWDGIKRDRLVWIGDMHPEVMTINSVFGNNEVVPKSLDLIRELTPLPDWMNGISSYSMWWIMIQRDWYYYQGDLDYLKQQKEYLVALLRQLTTKIDPSGKEDLDGSRFLDWPSNENKEAIHAGLQSMMLMTFQAGSELCAVLGDPETAKMCDSFVEKLKNHVPEMAGSKQAAALLSMSGLVPPEKANAEVLAKDGVHKMSTFYGYYMLKARAMAGDYQGAIDNIREYWGGMLDLGATTFWEDFDIDWMKNAARIDELVPEGKVDVHRSYGGYCYKELRHSFCHGWASGPTSWLSQYVLGVNVLEPGCKKIKIEPHLGDLQWVEGTFPTPLGVVKIKHTKGVDGEIETTYTVPKGVKVVK